MRIAEHLSRNVEWSTLRDITGTTDNTGKALRNLLSAPTADAARQAYWHKMSGHGDISLQYLPTEQGVIEDQNKGFPVSIPTGFYSIRCSLDFQKYL